MDGAKLIFTGGFALIIVILLMVFFSFVPFGLWVTAFFQGLNLKYQHLLG